MMEEEYKHKELTQKIISQCYYIQNKLGSGFLENVYQECLEIEMRNQKIDFIPQKEIEIKYKDSVINHKYRADLVCYDKIIVEVKAVSKLANEHKAQVINYLKATGYKLGILVNFGAFQKLEYERIVLEKKNFNRE